MPRAAAPRASPRARALRALASHALASAASVAPDARVARGELRRAVAGCASNGVAWFALAEVWACSLSLSGMNPLGDEA